MAARAPLGIAGTTGGGGSAEGSASIAEGDEGGGAGMAATVAGPGLLGEPPS